MDSVVLPCGKVIYKVYDFQFEHESNTIHVAFLHYGEYERTGADHSFSSEIRRSFARMLLNEPQPVPASRWITLPDHEYLQLLTANGFEYATYNICRVPELNRVHISVKAAQDGPQLITSRNPHFQHLYRN